MCAYCDVVGIDVLIECSALALLYAKEEADAAPGAEAAPLGRCISSLQKVSDCLDLAREMGDFALGELDRYFPGKYPRAQADTRIRRV